MSIDYNRQMFETHTMQRFWDSYKTHLLKLIDHCGGKEDTEITASDFDDSDIGDEELDAMMGVLEGIE